MKRIALSVVLFVMVAGLAGCTTAHRAAHGDAPAAAPPGEALARDRMLIWRAWLSLDVASVEDALSRVTDLAQQSGGYVESRSDAGDERTTVTLRVPSGSLKAAMDSLESLGKVTSRRLSSEDVTDQYVDIDARLRTMIALRDRLRDLLDQARDVSDVLAIEKELGRVQADIDSMQARLKAIEGRVDLATIHVSIRRGRILGPVGYFFKGAWWTIEKLFVIR